jgi:hypothetical protein
MGQAVPADVGSRFHCTKGISKRASLFVPRTPISDVIDGIGSAAVA